MGTTFIGNMTPIEDNSYQICELSSKRFQFVFNAFIPKIVGGDGAWFDGPKSPLEMIQSGLEFQDEHGPTEWRPQYKSDNRKFFENGTSRIHFEAGFEIAIGRLLSVDLPTAHCDASWKRIKYIDLQNGNRFSSEESMTAIPKTEIEWSREEKSCKIEATIAAHDPFFFIAPDIDINLHINVNVINSETFQISFRGRHDKYPAYEAFIKYNERILQPLWFYDPAQHGQPEPGLMNLIQPVVLESKDCRQNPKASRRQLLCEPIKAIVSLPEL